MFARSSISSQSLALHPYADLSMLTQHGHLSNSHNPPVPDVICVPETFPGTLLRRDDDNNAEATGQFAQRSRLHLVRTPVVDGYAQ